MSTLSLRLPDSLHQKVRELAAQDDISINQFIATAVAEKMSALLTLDYLKERAARGSRDAFERVLRKVPNRAPLPGDEWAGDEGEKPVRRLQATKTRRRSTARRAGK
jgi:predicted transcriptional regulator